MSVGDDENYLSDDRGASEYGETGKANIKGKTDVVPLDGPWGSKPLLGYWGSGVGVVVDSKTGRRVYPDQDVRLRNYQIYARSMAEKLINDARIAWGNEIYTQVYVRLMLGLQEWAKVMYQETSSGGSADELAAMHKSLATEIQAAIIDAYSAKHVPGKTLPYRWLDQGKMHRFSNRAMLRALKDSQFISSDKTGIKMVNTEFMDKVAPQWYRLNFGARPAPQPVAARSKNAMKWGSRDRGVPTKTRVFAEGKPSKPFFVPELATTSRGRGLWSRTFMAQSNLKEIIGGLGRVSKKDPDRPGSVGARVNSSYEQDLGRGITHGGSGHYQRGSVHGKLGNSMGVGTGLPGSGPDPGLPRFRLGPLPGGGREVKGQNLNSPNRDRSMGALYIVGGKNLSALGFEKRISKGITGSRFLDAGTDLLNKKYGAALHNIFYKWMKAGLKAGKAKAEWSRFSGSANVRSGIRGTRVSRYALEPQAVETDIVRYVAPTDVKRSTMEVGKSYGGRRLVSADDGVLVWDPPF